MQAYEVTNPKKQIPNSKKGKTRQASGELNPKRLKPSKGLFISLLSSEKQPASLVR